MKIKERKRDGVAILEMSGKLMGGPDAEAFDETLKTLIHEGCHNVIVNMEKVQVGQQHRAWESSSPATRPSRKAAAN